MELLAKIIKGQKMSFRTLHLVIPNGVRNLYDFFRVNSVRNFKINMLQDLSLRFGDKMGVLQGPNNKNAE